MKVKIWCTFITALLAASCVECLPGGQPNTNFFRGENARQYLASGAPQPWVYDLYKQWRQGHTDFPRVAPYYRGLNDWPRTNYRCWPVTELHFPSLIKSVIFKSTVLNLKTLSVLN
ncbi:hypothetical protein Ciccas_002548 [Cichlidogyrus casuarinus]|uniref:Uncharacterized protein n=1 Tax=Cichlidogyrus casuarinus TaxID=1844966 RepID=A0ABD2QH58_9PLAT